MAAAATIALLLVLPAEWLAAVVLKAPHLTFELRCAAVAVFFAVLNGYLTGALAGLESYRALATTGIASGVLYFLLCTVLAWRYGLAGAVGGVAISALVQGLLLAASLFREAARQGISVGAHGFLQERGILLNFAVPASLTGFLSMPAVWIASALLARQPGGYHQLALFGAANSYRTMLLFLPQTINNVGMSVLNNQRRDDEESFRRVFWMNTGMTAGAAAVAAVAILLASSPLVGLFGTAFTDGRLVLVILLVPAVIEATALAPYQLVVSRGRMWASLFGVSVPRDVTLVLFAAVLTPAFGGAGLAAAYTVAALIALGGILAIVSRLGVRPGPDAMHPAAN
jgi:O-antigen/teichoic acid export membrane protein